MVHVATVVFAPGGHVLTWGWFSIELANLLIILTMVVLFVVAILVPFRRAPLDAPDATGARGARGAHDAAGAPGARAHDDPDVDRDQP